MASGRIWQSLAKARDGVLSVAADVLDTAIDTVGGADSGSDDDGSGSDSGESTGSRFLADFDEEGEEAGGGAEEPPPPSPASALRAASAAVAAAAPRREAPSAEPNGCVALRCVLCCCARCAARPAQQSAPRLAAPLCPPVLPRVFADALRSARSLPHASPSVEPPWTDATPPPLPPRDTVRLGGGGTGLQRNLFATNGADAATPPPPQPDRQTSLGSLVDVPLSPLVPPRPFGAPPGEQARSRRTRPF
jgi:hypothetical protein